MAGDFQVRFWGVRGSIPCPGQDTLLYGGNTSCVEVRAGERLLILDAGSGLQHLGQQLKGSIDADLLLSHLHYDHILGLPFFAPAYDAGSRLRIWAGNCNGGIEATLQQYLQAPFFPVPLHRMAAHIRFEDFNVGDSLAVSTSVRVLTCGLNHPDGATAYRIEYDGRALCYVTDTEHPAEGQDEALVRLIRDADIVIYDATYNNSDYPAHRGWGHSTWEAGLALCEAAGVRRLVVFHHAPERTDAELQQLDTELQKRRPGSVVAREGLVLQL
ncbi:MBL fold metallo-hydrolase [Marinobacterium aestuarii]|uniref:MBL fold metallo-hydrolase n=1 Tax=Marinobacterium aestuarii TaxID=1821621 RepID=A0A1A9F0B2_9GAMM|nr:MBL fold metallo-hydrolase [Marinobacterium aestuarii]ANG63595.1 MBL fold metallo-hydrolase [Marinobacterium aestuarii]